VYTPFLFIFLYFLFGVPENDVCGLVGLLSRQKIIAALRMLALGVCADALVDYCRISDPQSWSV
jgi:hypothetical protein